jgi:hypothetical protein
MASLAASASQLEALDALCHHGTEKEAAAAIGSTRSVVQARIKRLRIRNRMTTVQLAWQRGRDSAIEQLTLWLDVERAA